MRKNLSIKKQWLLSIIIILSISLICYFGSAFIGYRVVALVLLMTVSILAMLFDIWPVMISAFLSAIIWNFFFIPPTFTFHIDTPEDFLMFLMYFVIAVINAVLTIKIREQESKSRDKEEKEKSITLYNTLFNSLSHELKTPISTIIASIDTLKENNIKLSDNNKVELLNEVEKAGLRLNRQVENLLNMSRLESGMLMVNKDWTDINELIFKTTEHFINVNTHTIIYIPREELPLVKLDSGLMETVLHNILYNAILYTPSDTTLLIEVELQQHILNIKINDEGNGFEENDLENIFKKFYRLPNANTGGTGLGLSIVKGFVEAHHGTISIKNRNPKGSCFNIEIPTETTYIKNLKNE